ncbi:hypothetical protein [Marinomonas mediterranea]|jgi:hypothetical protein|uniref:Uncharacterized protein n=1 Tax=Marinomonas mediterranea (strain ATCC 700492 / JCM 21426 / NBRC 103028 / MMB-1) TaxID=717774 RepID=F2JUQ4_MARM1|nr:hypothetical protein [Marinomonas mediterranea]ADZ90469.1 hypothetical protein Marme_1196 [Marinomonas mediterranea MMB-1]WCN08524.1 hypothetical protein GV055_06085 [Marinomonas mediterranea]WCN12578.1 hypothetical protein GV054_05925 [Marinomonas mediterranea]WCN16649.1 hypothetical protein GV053_06055 [Marinomonas mediterranea MMB-1]
MASELNQQRIIDEFLRCFRKMLMEPELAAEIVRIAKEHINDTDAYQKIAEEVSAQTTLKIPEEHSEADKMFINLLMDVVKGDSLLY